MIGALLGMLLQAPAAGPPSYEALVALGLDQAREGRPAEARATFDRAILMDGGRPEALVERSGLDFLEARYDAAADGLERALALRDDPYARELRASALQLLGRFEDALDEWNRLDQPRLGEVHVTGLAKTRDRVARRELRFVEGELLRSRSFREARLRLSEVGVFPRVRLRTVPREDRRADVEVALSERHGVGSWKELAVSAGANALRRQVRLGYWNAGGEGVVLRGEYKWESTQPHVMGSVSWPRPFGLPARLLVAGQRARPQYALPDGPLTMRTRGPDVALRRVVGPRTVVALGWQFRDRTFSRPRTDAPEGVVSALGLRVETSLVDSARLRMHVALSGGSALGALGSDVHFSQGALSLRVEREIATPDDHALGRSTIAARLFLGGGTSGMPVDMMYAPGAGSEAEYPLRGHEQKTNGILGATPIGRSMGLLNLEWRQRVWARPLAQLGFAVFADVIQITRRAAGEDGSLADVGVGLRLGWSGAGVVRVDYGWSLSGDGRTAFSAGFGHAF
jgi:hypothetical protein